MSSTLNDLFDQTLISFKIKVVDLQNALFQLEPFDSGSYGPVLLVCISVAFVALVKIIVVNSELIADVSASRFIDMMKNSTVLTTVDISINIK